MVKEFNLIFNRVFDSNLMNMLLTKNTNQVEQMRRNRNPKKQGEQINKIIHRIWIGGKPMPSEFVAYGETWEKYFPDWQQRLWTDKDDLSFMTPAIRKAYDECKFVSSKSDYLRFSILKEFSGMYVDTDMEVLKNFDKLINSCDFLAGCESTETISQGVLVSIPNHPFVNYWLENIVDHAKSQPDQRNCSATTGPEATTKLYTRYMLEGGFPISLFSADLFYPYSFYEQHRKAENFPDAYAVHHWAHSWKFEESSAVPEPAPTKIKKKCACQTKGRIN